MGKGAQVYPFLVEQPLVKENQSSRTNRSSIGTHPCARDDGAQARSHGGMGNRRTQKYLSVFATVSNGAMGLPLEQEPHSLIR